MCLMKAASWLLYLLIAILVICSRFSTVCAYLLPLVLFLQYTMFVWMIPLNLNWSRGLYSHLFWKSILLFCVTVFSFSFVYWFYGVVDSATGTTVKCYPTSLYFSVTTWSTLGYGDFRPVPSVRLLTSLEAILGVLSIPLIFTMIWKYCDFRIWGTSNEDEQAERKNFKLRLDDRGVWKQVDDNDQTYDLNQKYDLNTCKKCGATELKVERYFETVGVVSPRMQFMVHCTCGNYVFGKYIAMAAAHAWNKKNRKKDGFRFAPAPLHNSSRNRS